jgi:hypothetical protein
MFFAPAGSFWTGKLMPNCFLPLKPGQQLVVLYETKRGDRNLEQFPIWMLYELCG